MFSNRLYWQLFIAPLAQQKPELVRLAFSLLALSLIQGGVFLLLGPGTQALFVSNTAEVTLASVLPSKLLGWLPVLATISLPRSYLVYGVPAGLLVVALLRNVANYFYQVSTAALSLYLSKTYRERFFAAILRQSYLDIQAKTPALWMSHLMNDVQYLQTRFADILNSFVRDAVVVLSSLLGVAIIHPPTALVIILVSPLIAMGMGRTGKRIAAYSQAFQDELAHIAGHILELRRHFYFMRSQQGEARELALFTQLNRNYYQRVLRSILLRSAFAPLVEWLGFVAFAGFTLWVSRQSLAGSGLALSNLLVFMAALGMMLRPLRNFGEQLGKFHEAQGALAASLSMLAGSSPHQETAQPAEKVAALPQRYPISRMVSRFPGARVGVAVAGLELQRGRSIALVGASGSGKSTLLKTLAGLVHAEQWDLEGFTQRQFSYQVSMVSQAPFLFGGTVRENLLYGLEQPCPDSEIGAVLRLVAMADTVAQLPQGLDYQLTSVHNNLSGGQVQRLVIARALLRRAPILLLDEATSAVDEATEFDITAALHGLCRRGDMALLAITHRLQLLGSYDEIWFMDAGAVLATGTLAELLQVPHFVEFYREAAQ